VPSGVRAGTDAGRRRQWPSPHCLRPKSDGPHFGVREKWRRSGRAHFKRYGKRGLEGLRRVGDGVGGSVGLLKAKHLVELDAHLQANLHLIRY